MSEAVNVRQENEGAVWLKVDSLCKNENEFCGLRDVSFSVAKGGIHGILGAKGSGKTLLLDILAGCALPNSGEITVLNGLNVRERGMPTASRQRIGYVPAVPSFYEDMTVAEVLDFVGDARRVLPDKRYRQIQEALELTGLSEIPNRLIARLSREEKKRLSFAAALLGNTELLLLDEPLTGVGEAATAEILSLIRLFGKHKTVVLASARYALVRELCEDCLLLADGISLAQGSFEQLDQAVLTSHQTSLEDFYASLSEAASEDNDGEKHEELEEEQE